MLHSPFSEPLRGLTVLELGAGVAPAYTGWLLASLGAQVVKEASPTDRLHQQSGGLLFAALNRDKEIVAGGQSIREFDVVLEGLEWPAFAAREDEFARAIAGGLIVTSVSTFGRQGPYRARRGFALHAVAGSIAPRLGRPGDTPLTIPLEALDYLGGVMAATGTMLATRAAPAHGGQHVDVSTLDIASTLYNRSGLADAAGGGKERHERHGHRFGFGLVGVYPCKDGYVSLVTQMVKHWEYFFAHFGRGELLDDPRYDLRGGHVEQRDELEEMITDWFSEMTRDELFDLFRGIRVPFQPYLELSEAMEVEHLRSRGFWEPLTVEGVTLNVPASPLRHQDPVVT